MNLNIKKVISLPVKSNTTDRFYDTGDNLSKVDINIWKPQKN